MPNITTTATNPNTAPFYIYTGPSINELLGQVNTSPNYTPIMHSTWVNPYRFASIDRSDELKYRRYRSYDGHAEWDLLMLIADVLRTAAIVSREYEEYGRSDKHFKLAYNGRYAHFTREGAAEHAWHSKLQHKYNLHKAVKDAVLIAPPDDRHQLILEWPHVSETDPNRLAYTRDERGGREDRQVITSVGKYLRRHFSKLTDNDIRDITMRHGSFKFELWATTDQIIRSVQHGPASCMQWEGDEDNDDDFYNTRGRHPYAVYNPQYGWRAAVRLDGTNNIVGRCLVNVNPNPPIFVRSYAHKQDGYSHSDEALEVWLRDQGFQKASNWNGLRLAKFPHRYHNFIAPYLDGDDKRVDDCGDHLVIDPDGEYVCENTDGHAERIGETCACCENTYHTDELSGVGYHGDERVCSGCIDYTYVHVYGRRGSAYYLHQDDALFCEFDDNWYDKDYLSDNNIIELHDGDLCPSDQAVYLEGRDEYWHNEDEDVIFCEHDDTYEHTNDTVCLEDGTYAHTDNTWHCTVSGNYYHNDDDDDKRVEFCDVETRMEHTAHEDEMQEFYAVDLDDVASAIVDMTFA